VIDMSEAPSTGNDSRSAAPPPKPETDPRVSVIVPTVSRPGMLMEAIASALDQTETAIEIVVVADGGGGGDPATLAALARVQDPRLRVLRPSERLGNGGARNAGVAAARAPWVAFLDDDDLWAPRKLEAQLAEAERALAEGVAAPIVSCRFMARDGTGAFLWPRLRPQPGAPVADYLFRRRRPGTGDGVVQTSTILAPRALVTRVPFDPAVPRFTDIDWLLRAAQAPGAALRFAGWPEALSVWRMDPRPRISTQSGWRDDAAFILARRHLAGPRARAAFLLTLPSLRAAREGDRAAFLALLRAAAREGRPGWAELAFHCANFALPAGFKGWLARRSAGR
jgi:hypothetical protein